MTRTDKILINPLFRDHIGKIAAKEVNRKFCCHDLNHFIDTARISYIFFLEEQKNLKSDLNKELIYGAALLHDIGRWQEYETGEDHANLSALFAKPILEEVGFNQDEIFIICMAIREHRNLPQNPSLLGRYLYTGDKLSRPCFACRARGDCYKIKEIEAKEAILLY